jgi:hypothetical protein
VDDARCRTAIHPNAADKAILEAEWTPAAQADHEVNMARLKEETEGGRANKIIKPEEETHRTLRQFAPARMATACWA